MRALIKNSRKIVITHVDPSERALIDDFVRKSMKKATEIKSLYDIDNELDGISFELTGKKPGLINFKTPCIQVVASGAKVKVDLEVDSDTNIEINPDENDDYLEVSLEDKIISIKAKTNPELVSTTGQYIVTVILTKDGYETTIVPINVSVLYLDGTGTMDYESLMNLPSISGVTLVGSRMLEEFGIQEEMEDVTNNEIDNLFN